MAYNLLTGTMPLQGPDTQALAMVILTMPPPPASTQNAALPVAVDGVLSKALAKSAEQRFATCTGFVDALTGAFGFSSDQLQQLRAGIPKKPRREGGELTTEEKVMLRTILAERAYRAANPPAPIRDNDPTASPVPLDSATAAVVGWGMGKAFWIGMPAVLVLFGLLGWAVTRGRDPGTTGAPPVKVSPEKNPIVLACLKENISESICERFTQSCLAKEGKSFPACIAKVKTFKACLGLMGNEVDKCLQ